MHERSNGLNFSRRMISRSAVLCLSGISAAWSAPPPAAPPDAGQLLQDTTPPPSLPKNDSSITPRPQMRLPAPAGETEYRIKVGAFVVSGNTVFGSATLEGLLSSGVGQELTLPQMNAYADRITQYYRDRGYLVARAYIPQQDIRGGTLQIVVLEGRLAKVNLDNQSRTASWAIQPFLTALGTNRPVEAPPLEKQLLLISDLPGVIVSSVIKPGASVGDSELDVTTTNGPRAVGDVSVDNYGVRATGQVRGGGTLSLNGPLNSGDLLSVDAETSGHQFEYEHGEYDIPVGGYGTRLGVSGAHLSYDLGEEYTDLRAHGSANVADVFLDQPLWRGYQYNLRAIAGLDINKLHDAIDSAAVSTDKTVGTLTVGVTGDGHDRFLGGGASAWSTKVITGKLDIDGVAATEDAAPTGDQTDGRFTKFNGYAIRLQALPHQLSAYLALSGQAASKNLDSSQKFSVGGPFAVRAYQQGEGAADEAWLATLELRYDVPVIPGLQFAGFYDAGQARQERHPQAISIDNTEHLSGVGAAANWALDRWFRLATFVAWRTGDAPLTDRDRKPRVGAQAIVSF